MQPTQKALWLEEHRGEIALLHELIAPLLAAFDESVIFEALSGLSDGYGCPYSSDNFGFGD
jgi:hypothetical protein